MTVAEAVEELALKRAELIAYMNGMDRDTLDMPAVDHAYTFAEGRLAQLDMDAKVLANIKTA